MSQIDISQLPDTESLAEEAFPSAGRTDFRVHIAPKVHRDIASHAEADTSIEICGVLVGLWKKDKDGPYALISDSIRCDSASSKFAEVTFTHESWAQINSEMDSKYDGLRIIGWYHSHPDFGIFLSDRDCFIQENFFSGAGQIAYVVDPVRHLEGIFEWRKGKPEPISHYWVGDKIIPVEASKKTTGAAGSKADTSGTPQAEGVVPASRYERQSGFDLTTILSWLCLFLLGYLLAGTKSRWEQERIIQGTVAHYGINKLMRLGLEEHLQQTNERLTLVGQETNALLSVDQSSMNDEQRKEFAERRRRVTQALALARETLNKVEETYGYTDLERSTIASLVAAKQGELTRSRKSKPKSTKASPAESKPSSTKQKSTPKVDPPPSGSQ